MRIGLGYDSHRFTDGDHVMIGGVRIDHCKGVLAHSDGDVLLHALADALLGALALGDIGTHFPDTDAQYANVSSSELIASVMALLVERQYRVVNVDCVVICEQPKLKPHVQSIRAVIARLLKIQIDRVSVKATTNERMGFIGREEGLAAQVNVLLKQQ